MFTVKIHRNRNDLCILYAKDTWSLWFLVLMLNDDPWTERFNVYLDDALIIPSSLGWGIFPKWNLEK